MVEHQSNRQLAADVTQLSLIAPAPFRGPIEVSDPSVIAETYRFRAAVWKAEGVDVSPLPDTHTAHSWHWIVTNGGITIAAARLCIHELLSDTPEYEDICHLNLRVPSPLAFMSRLVVCPAARNFGLGSLLDTVRIMAARDVRAKCVVGQFPDYRVKRLLRQGFQSLGGFIANTHDNYHFQVLCLDLIPS